MNKQTKAKYMVKKGSFVKESDLKPYFEITATGEEEGTNLNTSKNQNPLIKKELSIIKKREEKKDLIQDNEIKEPFSLNDSSIQSNNIVFGNENPAGLKTEETGLNSSCLNNNSFIPMLEESEKFIKFLNLKFSLNLPNDYVLTINKASESAIGFFMPKEHPEHFTNSTQNLNNINLNTIYLKTSSPYEVLAHETAHFINHIKKIKDCSANQYHNKHFKKSAEMLLLSVERTNKGYNQTKATEEFNKMLEEFGAKPEVFNICQNQKEKKKAGSRLKLYICNCGVKVRCATELNAICQDCGSLFIKQDENEGEE